MKLSHSLTYSVRSPSHRNQGNTRTDRPRSPRVHDNQPDTLIPAPLQHRNRTSFRWSFNLVFVSGIFFTQSALELTVLGTDECHFVGFDAVVEEEDIPQSCVHVVNEGRVFYQVTVRALKCTKTDIFSADKIKQNLTEKISSILPKKIPGTFLSWNAKLWFLFFIPGRVNSSFTFSVSRRQKQAPLKVHWETKAKLNLQENFFFVDHGFNISPPIFLFILQFPLFMCGELFSLPHKQTVRGGSLQVVISCCGARPRSWLRQTRGKSRTSCEWAERSCVRIHLKPRQNINSCFFFNLVASKHELSLDLPQCSSCNEYAFKIIRDFLNWEQHRMLFCSISWFSPRTKKDKVRNKERGNTYDCILWQREVVLDKLRVRHVELGSPEWLGWDHLFQLLPQGILDDVVRWNCRTWKKIRNYIIGLFVSNASVRTPVCDFLRRKRTNIRCVICLAHLLTTENVYNCPLQAVISVCYSVLLNDRTDAQICAVWW